MKLSSFILYEGFKFHNRIGTVTELAFTNYIIVCKILFDKTNCQYTI